MNKKNTSGKVFDRIDKLCMWTLAYDANVPKKYRRTLWEPMRMYLDNAQACAEMAYLENDLKEKFNLVKEARKYFRIFKRYQYRCDMTGEFKFGNVYSVDMLEHIMLIEGELNRWFASLNKLVSNGAVAATPEHP